MLFVGQAGSLQRQHASHAAGFAAVTIAAAALLGWWTGLPLLSSWGSGFPAMKPATALCLVVLGVALMHPSKNSRFAVAVGLAVIAVAALDLFGVDFGINRWLVPRAAVSGASFRMINAMPLALGLAGGALALSRFEAHHFAATAIGSLTGVMAVFALLTYLTGIDPLYASIRPPPLPTVVGVLCVAGGVILPTMPALSKPRPLWHLLIVLGCAIIAPLLLFGAYAELSIASAQVRHALNDLMSEAHRLSAEVDHEINGEVDRLQALAASPSLRQRDFAEFQRLAEASLALRQSGNIVLVDRNMQQFVNTSVPFGTPLEKATVPEAVERSLATGKPQITGLFMGPMTGQPMFAITVPVQIDGENRYALVRSSDPHALASPVAAYELPPGWHAVVSDAGRCIIARSEQEDAFVGKELLPAQQHRARPDGVFEFVDFEGRSSLEAYVWSKLTGWQTAVWAPKALLEAPVRALWRAIGLTALLAFALVVALALWLGRIVSHSVSQTARAAIALGVGDPLPSDETPIAEVNTLMKKLRGAAALRQAAENSLRDSKDRLHLALNAAQLGWWQYDPRHRTLSGDTRSKEIFDIAADATPAEEIKKRVHPDDAEGFEAARKATFDSVDPKSHAMEFRLQRGDGEVRWVEVHWLTYFEGEGRERRAVSVVGTVQDITERKEREEKEHLLLREINHRAKNMLSVVHAIARQTGTKNPEDFIERFSARILALSANQDLLVRNEWNGVEIEDLVRAQLAPFAGLIDSRIAVHGSELRLKAASAQAIGLVLHELATNAGKYGALSTDRGRVNVCWRIEGITFTMSWIESDGPVVSAPERRGFGTIVMEAMAEHSVDGTVELDYASSGLSWRLTCPAANVLEPSERE